MFTEFSSLVWAQAIWDGACCRTSSREVANVSEKPGQQNIKTNKELACRSRISTQSGAFRSEELSRQYMEMPSVNPAVYGRQHRFIFGYTVLWAPYAVCVAKTDVSTGEVTTWFAGESTFCGEPSFVARPDSQAEDDGWLVAHVLDANTSHSSIVILDAADVAAGPVARMRLRRPMPHSLHCEWTSEVFAPAASGC